ncbi:MAG: ferritin [Undibacterium sp.]|nr:ferritin [Opitutaceae bacterium]
MLISKTMTNAINEQIGNEFGASMQYVAIASRFDADALSVLARHFYRQAEEERDHAMRFVQYLVDAGGEVGIPAIPAPNSKFKNVEAAIKLSLDQEMAVTRQINALVELAIKESDHITRNMLEWFLKEQLEEVSSMDNLLKVVQRAGESNLIHVEDYLGRRHEKGGLVAVGARANLPA